jgi:hypothetical protein
VNLKLDENLGPGVREVFVCRGHDCRVVREQNLSGAPDAGLLDAVVSEGGVLVTMGHDFGNVLVYPSSQTSGIAVLSPPGKASKSPLRALTEALLIALEQKAIQGAVFLPVQVRPGGIVGSPQ